MWAYCNYCNSDGSSIFDEWGGTGNLKDGQLKLTNSIEYIITPEEVADLDGYNAYYGELEQVLEKHKAKHIERGDIPTHIGEADVYIANVSKIYNVDSLSGHFETKESSWY